MRLGIKDTEVDTETILPLFASVLEMNSVGDKEFNLKSLCHQHHCHRLSVIGSRLNRSVRVSNTVLPVPISNSTSQCYNCKR